MFKDLYGVQLIGASIETEEEKPARVHHEDAAYVLLQRLLACEDRSPSAHGEKRVLTRRVWLFYAEAELPWDARSAWGCACCPDGEPLLVAVVHEGGLLLLQDGAVSVWTKCECIAPAAADDYREYLFPDIEADDYQLDELLMPTNLRSKPDPCPDTRSQGPDAPLSDDDDNDDDDLYPPGI